MTSHVPEQWSPPHIGAFLAFVDLVIWLLLVYLNIYCGLLHSILRSIRGIFALRAPYNAALCRIRHLHNCTTFQTTEYRLFPQ